LLGDAGGVRPYLAGNGLSLTLSDVSETLGNPVGGLRQQGVVEGFGFAALALDGNAANFWPGFTAQASAYGIYGRGLSANAVGNLQTVSNAEADRALRLFEFWGEQQIGPHMTARIGQQAADQEFMVDAYASPFINAHFGFADLPSNDLPSGGPAYPQATPAVRLKILPSDTVTLLAAWFNGNPNPPGRIDVSGTSFNTAGGALWFAEAQWARSETALPASYKLGAWYHGADFADQHWASNGVSLASPASSGMARSRRGDWSLYALADQVLWQPAGAGNGGINGFIRAMGAPPDRNLVTFSADSGLTWQGFSASRPGDLIGLGLEWAKVSGDVSDLDQDIARFSGAPYPVRRWEGVMEITYQAQIRGWWVVQPDVQFILRPGGGVPNCTGNAVVIGLRSTLSL
jgi:porin